MSDLPFQFFTALSPADCRSRISTAIKDKVWIQTGEPRYESTYMTGSVTSDAFVLREHRVWHDAPTYVTGTLQAAENGTVIDGKLIRDQTYRWWVWIASGLFLLTVALNFVFALKDLRAGPFHARDLVTHSSYRSGLLSLITIAGYGFFGWLYHLSYWHESKALKRFLTRLLEAREPVSEASSQRA